MHAIRFWLISFTSLITVVISSIFVPSSFINRAFSAISCTIFSFNSTFCTVSLWSVSDRVIAANPSIVETNNNAIDKINYLAKQQISSSSILLKQGTLQPGDSILADQRLFDSYDFSGRAGQSIIITLESQDFSPHLQLLNSQGKKIAESSNTTKKAIGVNCTIKIVLTHDDTYRVIVTSQDAKGKGRYTLEVSNLDNSRAISSTTPEGCKVVLNTKNVDGNPFPDYVEYIAKDKESCGNSFTGRVNSNGSGLIVTVETGQGPTTHIMEPLPPEQGTSGFGWKITTSLPDDKTISYIISTDDGVYHYTYQDSSGKHETETFSMPDDILNPTTGKQLEGPNEDSKKPESSYCKEVRKFCEEIEHLSEGVTFLEFASLVIPGLFPLIFPLAIVDTAVTLYKWSCAAMQGGLPPIPFSKMMAKANKLVSKFGKTKFGSMITKKLDELENTIAEELGSYGRRIIKEERSNESYNETIKSLYDDQGTNTVKHAGGGNWLDTLRESLHVSAPCKELVEGGSNNDPHLATFDGLKYDLQTVGEFILVKSNNGAFEVQARQTPFNNSASVSINSAAAMRVGSDRIAFYAQDFPDADTSTPLRINGEPTTIQGDKLALTGGGEILKQGSTYAVNFPTGEKVLVSLTNFGKNAFLNISPFVYNQSGNYSGLLGNVNGKPDDDQQLRGGGDVLKVRSTYGDMNKVLNQVGLRLPGVLDRAEQVYFDQLYKQFANSWRVKQEESLFDYPAGKTTESYVNPGFPNRYLTLNMLSSDQIQKANNACTKAKITQDLMEGCIFDVGFSGFSEFARATAEITNYVNIANQLFPSLGIPTPQHAVEQVIRKVKPRICLPFVGCH